MSKFTPDQNVARIKQEWLDYEGDIIRSRKPYNGPKKPKNTNNLGPASQAILEKVNSIHGTISSQGLINWCKYKTEIVHNDNWWIKRIMALVLEGHIHARVYRTGDKVAVLFRKKEAGK